MGNLKSRFGTLLKVRKYQEKKAQQELSQLRHEKAIEEDTLNQLDKRRDTAIAGADGVEKSSAQDIQAQHAFIRKLSKDIQEREKNLKVMVEKEHSKTDEVVERKKAKEMVENLEERFQTDLSKEADRKEQKVLDILAQRSKMVQTEE
jgi:flagellar export protein FliJ